MWDVCRYIHDSSAQVADDLEHPTKLQKSNTVLSQKSTWAHLISKLSVCKLGDDSTDLLVDKCKEISQFAEDLTEIWVISQRKNEQCITSTSTKS